MVPLNACQPCRKVDETPEPDRDAVLEEFLPTIRFHAARIKKRVPPHIEMDDLVSSGVMGLFEALDRFDSSRGIKFRTYADFRIRGAMIDYLRQMDWFPRSMRQTSNRLQAAYARLEAILGRPPEDEDVARLLGITLEELLKQLANLSGLSVLSFDESVDDPEGPAAVVHHRLAEAARDEAREEEILRDLKEVLGKAIDHLPKRERYLLALYYFEDLTMREISEIFRLGEPRICQLHSQAVLRLRGKLAAQFR
jgi:RNA polymerase sigma factor for flagellar operon FliA